MVQIRFDIGQEVYGTVGLNTGMCVLELNGGARYDIVKALIFAKTEPGLFSPKDVRLQNILVAFRSDEPFREPRIGTSFRATIGEGHFKGRFPRIGNRRRVYKFAEFEAGREMPEELFRAARLPGLDDVLIRYFRRAKTAVQAL
jgi:hypothetical protein